MQQISSLEKRGYNVEELKIILDYFENLEIKCEYVNLNDFLPISETQYNTTDAAVLIIRNGISFLLDNTTDMLFNEQINLPWDVKKLNKGIIANSKARRNLCYADFSQANNYETFTGKVEKDQEVKGTIIDFKSIEYTERLRNKLVEILPKNDDIDEGKVLLGEGNLYYEEKSYIGYHGDSERKTVICCSIGSSTNLNFKWCKK